MTHFYGFLNGRLKSFSALLKRNYRGLHAFLIKSMVGAGFSMSL